MPSERWRLQTSPLTPASDYIPKALLGSFQNNGNIPTANFLFYMYYHRLTLCPPKGDRKVLILLRPQIQGETYMVLVLSVRPVSPDQLC